MSADPFGSMGGTYHQGGYQGKQAPGGVIGGPIQTARPMGGLQTTLENYQHHIEGLNEVRQRIERTLHQLGAPAVEDMKPPEILVDRDKPDDNLSARYAFLTDVLRGHLEGFREIAERLERL